jgi:hypothetical protein
MLNFFLQTKYRLFFFRFALSDGHEQEQIRKEVDGAHVVIGFYKYIGNNSLHNLFFPFNSFHLLLLFFFLP